MPIFIPTNRKNTSGFLVLYTENTSIKQIYKTIKHHAVIYERCLILATPEVSDNNDAYWQDKYVIFDHKLDTPIEFIHFDADVTEFEQLSYMSGYFWPATYKSGDKSNNAIFRISDSTLPVYTTGVELPSTLKWKDLLYAYRIYTVLKYIDKLANK